MPLEVSAEEETGASLAVDALSVDFQSEKSILDQGQELVEVAA
jgi:hypothetical protein